MRWLDALPAIPLSVTGLDCVVSGILQARRRPSLYERLAPFQPSAGDEAESWLRSSARAR